LWDPNSCVYFIFNNWYSGLIKGKNTTALFSLKNKKAIALVSLKQQPSNHEPLNKATLQGNNNKQIKLTTSFFTSKLVANITFQRVFFLIYEVSSSSKKWAWVEMLLLIKIGFENGQLKKLSYPDIVTTS